ncbi:hypothetical protein AeMF1_010850 [Aphanomyces euteiches]|nr:hypothetical protein AeMF1_010850 [Aphanomyces euteiches]KAH9184373.1 hypothetical protein AeNC1_013652 [Aphanomyces euteiches]
MGKKDEAKEVVVESPVPPPVEEPKDPPGWEMVWSVLSKEQVEALLNADQTPTATIASLCSFLHVEHYDDNPRSRAWIDFFFYHVLFAKEEARFSAEKLGLFIAIMHKVFDHGTTPPLPTLVDNYGLLKQLLKKHSVDLPAENSVAIFTLQDVQAIVSYLATTFYQHFRVYQRAFTVHPDFVRVVKSVAVETPMSTLPLASVKELQVEPALEPPRLEAEQPLEN